MVVNFIPLSVYSSGKASSTASMTVAVVRAEERGKFVHWHLVSVLGREEGYTVKYTPPPEGIPEGKARGNS